MKNRNNLNIINKVNFTFLGSGGAFSLAKENYHSNILINIYNKETKEIKRLLFDAGTTISEALNNIELTPMDLNAVYVSHNHSDHVGGLEYLGFKTYFSTFPFGQHKIKLFGHQQVLDDLWEHSLKAGMRSLQGQENNLDTYFKPQYLKDNGTFYFKNIKFQLIQTIHMVDNRRIAPSYGLIITIKENNTKIFITGDTQFAPNQMRTFYNQSDVIFQDCELNKYPESVHAQYHELCTLPKEIKEKMWLYHYNGELPKDWKEQHFKGFIKKGQVIEF